MNFPRDMAQCMLMPTSIMVKAETEWEVGSLRLT